ncbi:DUF4226 domain-containing protein [Mycolicibacterium sphagni]|uniref:DUF4226 domain-containing protein n=1 Tax=Mycolicibacterium sphagni TaxID=1786 RepID=A0ABX2K051_9MYCO|nr:DUF4226 domain-containing protein [Mycolicibacterium sphagni]NTY62517.1 DUF4226 domain-containing protein [Mycolicibacterium sphagni]
MATAAEVVSAIDHILRYKPDWRGTLNDADFAVLNDIYQRAKNHPEDWLINRDLPITLDDKYLGALRLDNPTLFNGGKLFDPPGPPPATVPASVDTPGSGKPGQTPDPADNGFAGRAAEASRRVDDALAKNKTALAEADDELIDAVLGAKTGSDQGKAQLQALQSALVDQIHKLGPTLDTPAGQQQLNDFLQSRTQEILGVVKSSGIDAESKAEVLDALAQRYDAVKDSAGKGTGSTDPAAGSSGSGQTGSGAGDSAGGPSTGQGTTAGDPLGSDPLLNGLASDPLMGGLAGLAGPAMGALSGLPGAMGSMMPAMGGFGGGGGLGDLGGAIGGAIKDATARRADDHTGALQDKDDPLAAGKGVADPGKTDKADAKAEHTTDDTKKDDAATEPAAAKPADGAHPQPVAAEGGQVPAAQPGPDVSVKLPDGSTVTADSPQLAHAGRLVLGGANLDDAAGQAQVTVLPPGAPVNDPVSPSQLRLMDYAQFTDHRVVALGNGKVWLNGQVTPVEQMPTGPNFLGWARPQVQTAPTATAPTVLAGAN